MLAYAPRPQRQRLNPAALALILAAHAAAIAAVMSARMHYDRHKQPPTIVDTIPLPPEPRSDPVEPPVTQPSASALDAPAPLVPAPPLPGPTVFDVPSSPPPLPGPTVQDLPAPPMPGPLIGNGMDPAPLPLPAPVVRSGPRFATPDADIRPPYPEAMRAREQEAVLRLRLSIDQRGRVVAVEPVGKADPTFLAAARRHILKAWRYKPAMEGERAVAASTVVTLKFELD